MFLETITEKKLDINGFIDAVKGYKTLDKALEKLPSEYIEFYLKNEKVLNKALKKLHLTESVDVFELDEAEDTKYTGDAPSDKDETKVIKYKGQLIHLRYDAKTGHWVPLVAFRNIMKALAYSKELIDEMGKK